MKIETRRQKEDKNGFSEQIAIRRGEGFSLVY